jgi:Protein of unknown function (DUF3375)
LKPELYASTYERLRREPAWSLLTAQLAPQVLALLQHLLFTTDRVLPSSLLHQRLTTELDELRLRGRDIAGTASYYVSSWLREGWLERRLPDGAEEEEFELSTAALQALRLVSALQSTRAVATESRLSLVMDQLSKLAQDTDANPESRLERLYEERRRIDAEIDAVSSGRVELLPEDRALEQVREIIASCPRTFEGFEMTLQSSTANFANASFRTKDNAATFSLIYSPASILFRGVVPGRASVPSGGF